MSGLIDLFRPSCPVVFRSDYTMTESVARLRAATLPPGFDAESTESMMGSVEQDKVYLEHSLPWPNSQMLRPHFTGSFQQRDGKVVLVGLVVESTWMTFSLSPFNRLLRPSFRDEISWLSKAIEQVLTKPI